MSEPTQGIGVLLAAALSRQENEIAHEIANALYRHRYPRAMGGVADRDHPSHRRFWIEADAIIRALRTLGKIP